MKRSLCFLLLIATMIACKDNKSDEDLLIKGKWIWEDESNVDDKITLTFNNDGTYLIETYVAVPLSITFSPAPVKYSAEISGSWVRRGDEIIFTTSSVSIPGSDDLTSISIEKGDPIGPFWENSGNTDGNMIIVRLPDNSEDNIYQYENNENQIVIWKIIKLTDNRLIVSSGEDNIKYHRI